MIPHIAPVLPTDIEQRICCLTQTGDLHGLQQFFKHASAKPNNFLQLLEGILGQKCSLLAALPLHLGVKPNGSKRCTVCELSAIPYRHLEMNS